MKKIHYYSKLFISLLGRAAPRLAREPLLRLRSPRAAGREALRGGRPAGRGARGCPWVHGGAAHRRALTVRAL